MREIKKILNILKVILVLVSLVLIFNKQIRNIFMAHKTNQYQIMNVSRQKLQSNKEKEANYDFSNIKAVTAESVIGAQLDNQELPVIADIAIPDLKINLPIFKGLDNTALTYGAGTMKENQQLGQGNYALASHHVFGIDGSSNMLFSPLDNAQKGMMIYLTDKEYIYYYEIDIVKKVAPEQIDVISDVEGENLVTLVTCADKEATERLIVQGKYQKKVAFDKASKTILKAFKQSYNLIN